MYVKIKLSIQNNLSSKYALALYEICKDYNNEKKQISKSPKIKIDELKMLLMGTKEKYKNNFKLFNFRVVKKAIKDINENADLEIKTKYFKKGRSIDEIQFIIKKKGHTKPIEKNKTYKDHTTAESTERPVRGLEELRKTRESLNL